ncbi:MAG: DUF1674 domain-containing protein [Beijerinckiaceae bacterium]
MIAEDKTGVSGATVVEVSATERVLSPAAQRALAEAAARRAAQEEREAVLNSTGEINGRGGKDPVRYNDWEIKGLTSDF